MPSEFQPSACAFSVAASGGRTVHTAVCSNNTRIFSRVGYVNACFTAAAGYQWACGTHAGVCLVVEYQQQCAAWCVHGHRCRPVVCVTVKCLALQLFVRGVRVTARSCASSNAIG